MAYRANPFLERMSERTTSDQEFVRLFSPRILERLSEDALDGGVHVFRSPPGGGKTTLLRAFTPAALRAFWNARRNPEMAEAYHGLVARRVLHEQQGPQTLGVLLSCASGYADLPPGASNTQDALFRSLIDCRVVLRALRSLSSLLGYSSLDQLEQVRLEYDVSRENFAAIPKTASPLELLRWAEQEERAVYASFDQRQSSVRNDLPHVRLEAVLWLQSVVFRVDGAAVAPRRLLMIDDVQKLRRRQREVLMVELTEARPQLPVWLAERSIALGDALLSQGAREGRDIREYSLDQIWPAQRAFISYAQNILDRRLEAQNVIPGGGFAQYLRTELDPADVREELGRAFAEFRKLFGVHKNKPRYSKWAQRAEELISDGSLDAAQEIVATRILMMRDQAKDQQSLGLPLSREDLADRDSSSVKAAALLFLHHEAGVPYYFGLDVLCAMATNNVEELLALAAALYDGLKAKQVLRKPELVLSPREQERLLTEVAKKKRDFIPKSHTIGSKAQRLLDAIGAYCREKTLVPNAPYAPGVTGVRLSDEELGRLDASGSRGLEQFDILRQVLAECVAENLLVQKPSAASTARRPGTVFYLNRTLCAHYELPLQYGGWQDVRTRDLLEWMDRGKVAQRKISEM